MIPSLGHGLVRVDHNIIDDLADLPHVNLSQARGLLLSKTRIGILSLAAQRKAIL